MDCLKKFGDLIFGESVPKKTENVVETKQPKENIIKTVLNQDLYGFPRGTPVYITRKNWNDKPVGRVVLGWRNIEDFGKTNFAICYDINQLEYDSSNEQSYSIIIQNVKRGVSEYKPSFEPEDNGAVIKYEIENSMVIASLLNLEDATTRATTIAEALKIEGLGLPEFIDNLYIWSSLPELVHGKGVKVIVQPD